MAGISDSPILNFGSASRFKEQDAVPLFRDERCHGAPGGSASDNDGVVGVGVYSFMRVL